MGWVIDSSVLIAGERQAADLEALLATHASETVVMASITASELLEGVHRADTERRRAAREAFVENLLVIVPVVAFDLRVARAHARLRARLPRAAAVGAHDLIIAATAVALDFGVLTRDRRSFPRIPDLDVVLC